MTAICKNDYGQFEYNKRYKYSFNNKTNKFQVNGEYSKIEFNKKQFESIFIPRTENKIYEQ
jgi:hypothetical protein